ncbi:MAG TPA: chemotaxis protein CheA [Oscillospiraceae bacterium]|nr:chemotaxis protein CheA [Oscillospiraceae bacterium]
MSRFESGMEAMLDMYIFETNTLLEQLDEILLRTEKSGSFTGEDINEIFRIMHTIKGSSAMMGLEMTSTLTHALEDMFFIIREDPSIAGNANHLYDFVFQASDFLKAEIELMQSDDYQERDTTEMKTKLHKYTETLKSGNAGDATTANPELKQPEAPTAQNEAKKENTPNHVDSLTTVRVFFDEGCKMENLRAFLLITKIKDECAHLEYYPSDIEVNADSSKDIIENGFIIIFRSHTDKDTILKLIEEAVNVQSYEVLDMQAPAKKESAKSSSITQQTAATDNNTTNPNIEQLNNRITSSKAGKQSLISVNLNKLDQLHDIVGEIIMTESMVISNPDLTGLQLDNFQKSSRQLRKLTDELQDIVMSIRMVPLKGVFQKLNRIVRDMKIKLGKDVDVVFEGEETEVDKSIIDNLNDPLMHLVRNCMDHGIESTTPDRIAAGKPETGVVTISAENASGEVIIVVSDDGRGIDAAKVLKKAAANGLLNKPESEYSEKEIFNMILLPGFSTNEQVTEFSGRGVGMDVVKKNIEKVGGTVSVESKKGKGTSFIIKIPLTLAIIDGMEISVGNSIFTIPISSIRESFKIKSSQIINDTEQGEMILIRGVCYPILRLHSVYDIDTKITEIDDGIIILVEAEDKAVCMLADKLIGEQQVVVKPFPTFLNKYNIKQQGISGCTIKGDGTISLILDVVNCIANY